MSKQTEKERMEEKVKQAREVNSARNADRLKLMESIADSYHGDEPEEEAKDEVKEEPKKDEEVVKAEETAKALQEEGVEVKEEPKQEELADEKDINGVRHYLQVVNGQEKWMTLKQIRDAAQKVDSADEYLRTAAEAARSAAAGAPSKDESPSLGEDEIADLLRKSALAEDEAIRSLAKLIAKPSGLTPDALQAIDQRLSFRTELAELKAKSRDLLEDPNLGLLFEAKLQQLKQTAPQTRLSDAYSRIDKELRTAFPGFKSSKLTEKLERKRTLPQIQSAATRQSTGEEEEGEENYSAVIERMAQARGQTPRVHPRKQ